MATIKLADGRGELYQWDTGRKVVIDDESIKRVHYQNRFYGRTIDVDVTGGFAIVPDRLLQSCAPLVVFAWSGNPDDGYTKIEKTFEVNRRNKPSDYVFTPVDQKTLDSLQEQIGDLADLTTAEKGTLVAAINEVALAGGAGSMDLRVSDGYIQYSRDDGSTWQNLIAVSELKGDKGDPGEKGDTGAQGVKGDTGPAGPQGLVGAPGKDGAKGDPGTPGKDGHSPVVTATKSGKTTTISVDGAAIATVKDGTDGAPGKDGADGKPGAPGKDGAGMDITGATVGQIAKITAVDASGVPTAWSPVDIPSGGSSFTDDGDGNISVDGATAQSVNRFLQSLTFPGLNFKYLNPMNSGTYSDPYGIKVGSGASLVDTILTKTVPGVYTVYMNRNATDVPAAAAAASSSLRGLVILSQIKKHYAIILLVDQSSNFYVQYIQNDVGGGWKQMPDSSASAEAVLYTAQTLTDEQKKQARENVEAAAAAFVVNAAIHPDGSVTLDKTAEQIRDAIDMGKTPVVLATGVYLPMILAEGTNFIFGATAPVSGRAELHTVSVSESGSNSLGLKLVSTNANNTLPQQTMAFAPTSDMEIATKKYVDDKECILQSTTAGSTKKFKITVDDSGALSAVEVTE